MCVEFYRFRCNFFTCVGLWQELYSSKNECVPPHTLLVSSKVLLRFPANFKDSFLKQERCDCFVSAYLRTLCGMGGSAGGDAASGKHPCVKC